MLYAQTAIDSKDRELVLSDTPIRHISNDRLRGMIIETDDRDSTYYEQIMRRICQLLQI